MAIHFDFTVSDVDAENIMSALHQEICSLHESILKRLVELNGEDNDEDSYIKWYNSRIEYIKELKLKMKNTRVEDKEDSSFNLAEKIIDLSLHWTGDDEERIPELKTIRTLAGIMMREDLK